MKLTREQRADFFRGGFPRITYPGEKPCPIEVGQEYRLSTLRHLVVTAIRRSRKGEWVVMYEVRVIEGPLYLASGAPRAAKPEDRESFTEEQARGYTRSRSRSVDPDAGAILLEADDPIVVDARKRFAEHQDAERGEEQARKDFKVVTATIKQTAVELARAGGDPVAFMADIQRVIQEHRGRGEDAA